MNQPVRIIRTGTWNTPPSLIGRTGRVKDREAGLFYVALDGPHADNDQWQGRYWAYPTELEAL